MMLHLVFLLWAWITCVGGVPTDPYDSEQMVISGDFVLGAIFPIRSYGRTENKSYWYKQCGGLETTFVLQSEAFRLSLEYVNERLLKQHGYTMGGLVVDECDNPVIGLQSAVKLMAGEFGNSNWGVCSKFPKDTEQNRTFIYGMTGGTNSVITERVEPLLEVFCLPLISTYATAHAFDDAQTYQYFLRTVPSDVYQAKAVYDLLRQMQWYTVAVIYEKTPYGSGLYDSFRGYVGDSVSDTDICITVAIPISNEDPQFEKTISEIDESGAFVVIVFTDFTMAKGIFLQARSSGRRRKYQWVGTDGWGRSRATVNVEAVVENAVTTEFYSHNMPLIENHIRNLTFGQAAKSTNGWLRELVAQDNNCTSFSVDNFCPEHPRDRRVHFTQPDAGLGRSHYVFEAVYSFALAFEELRQRYCSNDPAGTLCPDFYQKSNGKQLLDVLKQVLVHVPEQLPREFAFHNHSGPPNYSIFQFQDTPVGFKWVPVGNWTEESGLNLDESCHDKSMGIDVSTSTDKLIRGDKSTISDCVNRLFQSDFDQCRPKCEMSQRRNHRSQCCWKCESCQQFEYKNNSGLACESCPLGEKPDRFFNSCVPDQLLYLGQGNYFWPFMLLTAIGIIASIFLTSVFVIYRNTPAATLASYPLCIVGTVGTAGLFASTILTLARPSGPLCAAQWSLQPFFFTVILGAIMVRTFQFSRENWSDLIYAAKVRRCALVRGKAQFELLIICLLEAAIIVIVFTFLLNDPDPSKETVDQVHMERVANETVIACSCAMDVRPIFLLFVVPTILFSISILLAFRHWKSRVVFERRENRCVLWSCGSILLFSLFVVILILTIAKTPIHRTAMQLSTMTVFGFVCLLHYAPIALIMLRGYKNTVVHLTRDVKDDDRIRSDQLTLAAEVIGEGYFCEVRRGKYLRNKRQVLEVAAKVPKTKSIHDRADLADLSDSLLQEIMILRHVRDCENIVRLFGVCNDSESAILVFEYVNGESCSKFIPSRRNDVQISDLLFMAANIADALCFLKQKSIVHRDVKCANCLVHERTNTKQPTTSGSSSQPSRFQAKLADFGIAVEANRGQVDKRRIRLFPARHTAPEGFFGNFSYESDVWSFGVFMWEIFTLKSTDNALPYYNVPDDDIQAYIAAGNILPRPEAASVCLYENIMKQCWAYEPSNRIIITRLKNLLVTAGRKLPSEKTLNGSGTKLVSERLGTNGTMWYGAKRNSISISTPDLFRAYPTVPLPLTQSRSAGPIAEEGTSPPQGRYKMAALSTSDITKPRSLDLPLRGHKLQPAVIIVNDVSPRPITPPYRKFT